MCAWFVFSIATVISNLATYLRERKHKIHGCMRMRMILLSAGFLLLALTFSECDNSAFRSNRKLMTSRCEPISYAIKRNKLSAYVRVCIQPRCLWHGFVPWLRMDNVLEQSWPRVQPWPVQPTVTLRRRVGAKWKDFDLDPPVDCKTRRGSIPSPERGPGYVRTSGIRLSCMQMSRYLGGANYDEMPYSPCCLVAFSFFFFFLFLPAGQDLGQGMEPCDFRVARKCR